MLVLVLVLVVVNILVDARRASSFLAWFVQLSQSDAALNCSSLSCRNSKIVSSRPAVRNVGCRGVQSGLPGDLCRASQPGVECCLARAGLLV